MLAAMHHLGRASKLVFSSMLVFWNQAALYDRCVTFLEPSGRGDRSLPSARASIEAAAITYHRTT